MYPHRIRRTAPPSGLPLSLETAKAHLRVETDAEDALITGYIRAAGELFASYVGLPLLAATYVAEYTAWGTVLMGLPGPVVIIGAAYQPLDLDTEPVTLVVDTEYAALASGNGLRIRLTDRPTLTAQAGVAPLAVTYTAGFADADALAAEQPDWVSALLQLVGHQYEQRQPVTFANLSETPALASARQILDLYRCPAL